jgi:site-specific recombinase XerD
MTELAPALQAFFTERLIIQRGSSPETVAAYRDAFRLLLRFAHEQTGKQPFELDIDDLDAPLIGAFLKHLEEDRGNSPRTRNARLGAIHSFYRFAALEHPEHAHTIARVMAIPTKRHERNTVSYLDRDEIKALLAAPDKGTWLGRRDHALLAIMIQTGVRVSELTGLRVSDVHLGTGAHIRVTGKGRKKRSPTLTSETVKVVRAWLKERRGEPDDPLFPTRQGRPLSRYAVGVIVTKHATAAAGTYPSLTTRRVTPHTLRHTNAMLLRAKGVDIATIALWLGHESTQPPTSTSTPTPPSRSKRSHAPPRSGRNPADTGPPTHCSRSSKASDYVERITRLNRSEQGKRRAPSASST